VRDLEWSLEKKIQGIRVKDSGVMDGRRPVESRTTTMTRGEEASRSARGEEAAGGEGRGPNE